MKELSEQRFFRLLSEYSQKEFAVNDLTAALQELANHLASIAINEQDYAIITLLLLWTKQAQIVSLTIWAGGKMPCYYLLMKQ